MLSKEEAVEQLKDLKIDRESFLANDKEHDEIYLKDTEAIETALKELETKERKLIQKLVEDKKQLTEELKYNITKREARLQLQLVDNYLKILKGENGG